MNRSDVRTSSLTPLRLSIKLIDMSLLELKQPVSRLSQRERRELQVYLVRLRHATPASRRSVAKRIRDMKAGRTTSLEALEAQQKRG